MIVHVHCDQTLRHGRIVAYIETGIYPENTPATVRTANISGPHTIWLGDLWTERRESG